MRITRKELQGILIFLGADTTAANSMATKVVGKKDIELTLLFDKYLNSKSKYRQDVLDELEERYPEIRIWHRELVKEQIVLMEMMGMKPNLPSDLVGLPHVEAIKALYIAEGKKEKMAGSLAKRSVDENGLVKPRSKFERYFL